MTQFINAEWPAPDCVKACTTTRIGGESELPYDSFNLGEHVGDQPTHLTANRDILKKNLRLTDDPIWIKQTHSAIALEATSAHRYQNADASFSATPNTACVVLTADCLPLLICNKKGTHIAAIHAGWRGLANGIIGNTLQQLSQPTHELLVWLGPAISAKNYEVGHEVREQFLQAMPSAESAFTPSPNQRWLADLYELARIQLHQLGVQAIYGGNHCTFAEKNLFYSYRRDGEKTGRMASIIWIAKP